MQFFEYVPTFGPVGMDLETTIWYAKLWVVNGYSPYVGGGTFPPLAHILFAPFVSMEFSAVYKIFTGLTLLSFLLIAWLIPVRLFVAAEKKTVIVLIFITGLFSYGLQFEIERGQFGVIAYALSVLSVFLFYKYARLRLLAYLLLSVAIQLKIYPAIFALMLIQDWKDWQTNLKRMIGLAAINMLALFSLGGKIFLDFIDALRQAQFLKGEAWVGNHSISSFMKLYAPNAGTIEIALLILVAANYFLVLFVAYIENTGELNVFLLASTTMVTLLIPSINHDYRLSVLPAAMAMSVSNVALPQFSRALRLPIALLLTLMSAAYASTLFSYTNKPEYLSNNMPALMVILLLITLVAALQHNYTSVTIDENPAYS